MRFGDAEDYQRFATAICTGTYPDRGNLPIFRAPGMPFFIAVTSGCSPFARVQWTKAALALVDVGSVALLFSLAGRFGLRRRQALAVAAAAAAFPPFLLQTTDLRSEPLAMAFLLASFALLLRTTKDSALRLPFWSGVALGAAALVRPTCIIATAPWILFLLLCGRKLEQDRALATGALILALGVTSVVAPWTARNYLRFGDFVLINDAAGFNFARSASPELEVVLGLHDARAFAEAEEQFETRFAGDGAPDSPPGTAGPAQRERWYWRRGLAALGSSPRRWIGLLGRNVGTFWRPWVNPTIYGNSAAIASSFAFVSIDLLALFGWRDLHRTNRKLAWVLLAYFAAITLVHSPFQAMLRYRLPLAEPILLLLAAVGCVALSASPHRRRISHS